MSGNLNRNGNTQEVVFTSEPIDLATLNGRKTGKVECITSAKGVRAGLLFLCSYPTYRSIPLKQNLGALFSGHEQGLTLTSEPIDLSKLLFSKTGKAESIAEH
jgi:hypothetical protein